MDSYKKSAIILFVVVSFSSFILSLIKSFGAHPAFMQGLEHFMGNDTVLHFSLAATLGVCSGWLSILMRRPIFLVVVVALVIDEALQFWLPTREFSWSDMSANVFGCLSGVLVVALVNKVYSALTEH